MIRSEQKDDGIVVKGKYPEHEKLSGVKELSQQLGSVLDWMMNEKGWQLKKWMQDEEGYGFWGSVGIPINQILSEFYRIDLVKLEEEKQQMLNEIRNK